MDIATELNFTKPSVSVALKLLKGKGYVRVEDNIIFLTDVGYK